MRRERDSYILITYNRTHRYKIVNISKILQFVLREAPKRALLLLMCVVLFPVMKIKIDQAKGKASRKILLGAWYLKGFVWLFRKCGIGAGHGVVYV